MEKESKPKIKVLHKNKNKNRSVEKIESNNYEILLNNDDKILNEPSITQTISINSKNYNFNIPHAASPKSINTKAKAEPLKFVADYNISKNKLNIKIAKNTSNKNKLNKKNDKNIKLKDENNNPINNTTTVFDIIKDINKSNNDLERQLNKFKGKIDEKVENTHSRNRRTSKNEIKNDSSTKKSSNPNLGDKNANFAETYNSPSSSRIRTTNNLLKTKLNKKYNNEVYDLHKNSNQFSNNSILDSDGYYNSNLGSYSKKPYKKIIKIKIKNKNDWTAKSQKNVKTKNRILHSKKKVNNKSKRYNSSININGIEINNFDDKYINYNNTLNSNYPNYYYTSNSSTKRMRKIKNNSLGQSTERKYLYRKK